MTKRPSELAIALSCALLSACAPQPQIRELANPSVDALMALPVPRFFATLRLADAVTARCPRYGYDAAAAQAMTDARTRDGAGRYTAIRNSKAIDLESDLLARSFTAKYGRVDACAALDAERAAQTALSAVLVAN